MLEIQSLNTLNMYVYIAIMQVNYILSPLDQFEIRDLLSLNISLLNNTHISLTNIGLYLIITTIIIFMMYILATNYNIVTPNN